MYHIYYLLNQGQKRGTSDTAQLKPCRRAWPRSGLGEVSSEPALGHPTPVSSILLKHMGPEKKVVPTLHVARMKFLPAELFSLTSGFANDSYSSPI